PNREQHFDTIMYPTCIMQASSICITEGGGGQQIHDWEVFQVVDAKHVRPSCFPFHPSISETAHYALDSFPHVLLQLTHILLRGTRNSLSRGAVAGTYVFYQLEIIHLCYAYDKVAIKKIDTNASQEFLNEYKITFLKYNIFNLFFGTHIVAVDMEAAHAP
ncbi:hypothetical protein ACJX0J_030328, partial [Zea mays]